MVGDAEAAAVRDTEDVVEGVAPVDEVEVFEAVVLGDAEGEL